jgi:hypothetical protein
LTKGETQVPSELCSELCKLMGAMVLKSRMLLRGLDDCNDEALGLQNSFLYEEVIPSDDIPLCLDDSTATDVRAITVNWWNIEDNREDVIEVTIAESIAEIDDHQGGGTVVATNEDEDAIHPPETGREEEVVPDDPPCPLPSYHEALDALEEVRRYVESK